MKQTERIFFFFYDWLSGRHKAAAEKDLVQELNVKRLWTTSSHHGTTPSTRSSHSTLFLFAALSPNSDWADGEEKNQFVKNVEIVRCK